MQYNKLNQVFYESFSRFSGQKKSSIILSIWAFLEASFFFVAPDFILTPLSFFNPKEYKKLFLITLISALIGGIFYFVLNILYISQLS